MGCSHRNSPWATSWQRLTLMVYSVQPVWIRALHLCYALLQRLYHSHSILADGVGGLFSPLHLMSLLLSRIRLWGYLVNWVKRSFRLLNTELGPTALAALESNSICAWHVSVTFRYGNIPVGCTTPVVFCFLSCVSVFIPTVHL